MQPHQYVFVGGLHRSGTSLLARCIAEHPLVSGFRNTGVPEDEGQHLQTVVPPASAFGGPGKFGFDPAAHLTEASELATEESRRRMLSEWERHWDLEKPILMEKSPPNLIRTRFLQALFPEACFIIVIRHPIAVAYATQKWSGTSVGSLIEHWLACHERFEQDRPHLGRLHVLRYEDLVERPQAVLQGVFSFLGLQSLAGIPQVRPDVNAAYFEQWRGYADGSCPEHRSDARRIVLQYGSRVGEFGYDLKPPG